MSFLNRAHFLNVTPPQQMIETQLELEDRTLLVNSAHTVTFTEVVN